MIKQKFKLHKYLWKVYVYYNATYEDIDTIVKSIRSIKLPSKYCESAYTILKKGVLNNGLTLSNLRTKSTIIVISKTSNASEFVNSMFHEIYHLVNHISKEYNIDNDSEEPCYLFGEIAQTMYKACHHLMCDNCKNE